jgi:hypothetical protein
LGGRKAEGDPGSIREEADVENGPRGIGPKGEKRNVAEQGVKLRGERNLQQRMDH